VTENGSRGLIAALDEAPLSRFHLRAVVVSGMGFFTDAYDLFVIGIVSTLITAQWHLSPGRLALLNSTMLGAAFVGRWSSAGSPTSAAASGSTGWSRRSWWSARRGRRWRRRSGC
jgi:hypothetical protein